MKKQLLLILGLMFTATLFASPVSKDRAKETVLSFLKSKNGNRMFAGAGFNTMQLTNVELESNSDAYYVFNIGKNNGFVIVSGDDRTESILGYAYEGSFDPQNVPANMQAWLNGYAKQINMVRELNIEAPRMLAAEGTKKPYRHFIPTMLTCKWNQTAPYNDRCPKYPGDYEPRPTGCVATAMAQVMYFHKWPKDEVPAMPGYTFYDDPQLGGNGANKSMPALDATTLDWDNMIDEYGYNSLKESKEAVAELMLYVGQSLKMGYHPYASGAYTFDIPKALRNHFNYDKGARYLDRAGYTSFEWEEIVYNELVNNRPVLYSGMSYGAGGHQFVCDGYENEFYHFNWGWGGVSDGYFKLNALEPDQEGVVGGNGLDFSDGQQIVIGVQPPTEGTVQPEDTPVIGKMMLTKNQDGAFKKNNLGNISLAIESRFGFDAEKDGIYTVGFGVFDSENKMIGVAKQVDKQFIAGYTDTHSDVNGPVSVTSDMIAKDGVYYLRAIVKSNTTGQWNPAPQSDKLYFQMDVKGEYVQVTQFPYIDVDITDYEITGVHYAQTEMSVLANIYNKGVDFDGILSLVIDGKLQSAVTDEISMRHGETKSVILTFNFPGIGVDQEDHEFSMAINGRNFGTPVVDTILKSETKSAALDFVPAEGFTSEGNFLEIPVEITNKSANNPYKSAIRVIAYMKSGYNYIAKGSVLVPVSLEKSEKTNVTARIENLEFNKIYYLAFSNYSYGREKMFGGVDQKGNPNKTFSKYRTADALSYCDEAGNMNYKLIAEGETFDIPANACLVEIPKEVKGRTINKSANPNCLYKMRPGVSVPSLNGCNIVRNGISSEINLTDANSFFCDEDLSISKFNVTINVENNITTLWLPFNPESATVDGVELTRGNSIEDIATCDYTLLPFSAEDENAVYCDFSQDFISAPCILQVNSKYIGKSIVFTASSINTKLVQNTLKGSYYNIISSNADVEHDGMYGFGITDFSKGIKKAAPFRVYLKSVDSEAYKVNVVYPDGFISSGIEDVNAEDMTGKMVNIYSVDGVKVRTVVYGDNMLEGLPSGLYIVNGKKLVK